METPEALRPRVREQQLIARLRLATTRLADADRERIWAIVVAKEVGLSIRKYVRLAAHRCPSLAATQVTAHVLRHTCAMMILQATGNRRNVSRWLGHADMHTTEVSLRADPTDKMEAIEAMIPMFTPSLTPLRVFLECINDDTELTGDKASMSTGGVSPAPRTRPGKRR
jgi:integrase